MLFTVHVTMPRASTMLLAGIMFTSGLLLGLLLHLPGAYSPSFSPRHRRNVPQASVIGHRNLLALANDQRLIDNVTAVDKGRRHRENSELLRKRETPKENDSQLDTVASVVVMVNISAADNRRFTGNGGKHTIARADNGQKPSANAANEIEIDLYDMRSDDKESDKHVFFKEPTSVDTVVDGIYWSDAAETLASPGLPPDAASNWRHTVDALRIVHLEEGCGRMQNRRLTLDDGTAACARYRLNTDQMQGDVYSYYLARILGVRNVPPVVLLLPDMRDARWASVDAELVAAQWNPSKVVALTPWLDHLTPTYIPETLRRDARALLPDSASVMSAASDQSRLSELVQWSDLIVFDYLTANMDRMVNNMFNLQWNSAMMDSPTHNLEKSSVSGTLVFLDNESGLFHSYRLLPKYSAYHEQLLRALCVFRKRTADVIAALHASRDIGARLQTIFEQNEPLWRHLPRMPQSNVQMLQQRIDNVFMQIQTCKSQFETSNNR